MSMSISDLWTSLPHASQRIAAETIYKIAAWTLQEHATHAGMREYRQATAGLLADRPDRWFATLEAAAGDLARRMNWARRDDLVWVPDHVFGSVAYCTQDVIPNAGELPALIETWQTWADPERDRALYLELEEAKERIRSAHAGLAHLAALLS